jgi:hypothetical protein
MIWFIWICFGFMFTARLIDRDYADALWVVGCWAIAVLISMWLDDSNKDKDDK